MSDWKIYLIGFSAQLLFSIRLVDQWLHSEKKKRVVTPASFWQISLLASLLLFVYGYLRSDFAIMLGQGLTYFIYVRNLELQNRWKRWPLWLRIFILLFPVFIVIYSYNNSSYDLQRLFFNDDIPLWLLYLGSGAHLLFTFRFVYQWIYSEKIQKSTLPMGFWLLSLSGALLILLYAVLRQDPVLFIGHLTGSLIYLRNIFFYKSYEYRK